MSTRGLIIVKENKKETMIYNHSDSYPSNMMIKINQRLLECRKANLNYLLFKEEILSVRFTDTEIITINTIKEIDYLFHEYIYILDFDKKTWSAYRTQFTEQGKDPKKWDNSKGKLIRILLNIPFDKEIKVYEDEDLEEDKAIIVEEREEAGEPKEKLLAFSKEDYVQRPKWQ